MEINTSLFSLFDIHLPPVHHVSKEIRFFLTYFLCDLPDCSEEMAMTMRASCEGRGMFRAVIVWEILTIGALAPTAVRAQSGSMGAPCGPPTCKVCVPEPAVVKTKSYEYDCKPVDYCLKKCTHCCCLFGKCSDAGCQCTRVHTKIVLLKKVVNVEKNSFECKVVERPLCAPACPITVTTPIPDMPALIHQPALALPQPPPPTPRLAPPMQ